MRLGSRRRSSVAPGLVQPYPALKNAGLRLRRGQTSLTVAAPGAGKSQLWANLAHRMQVPTLYWSADTDQTDVTIRSFALHTSMTTEDVEKNLDDESWRTWMLEQLGSKTDHIEWVFDSPITGRGLGERMKAFRETHGTFPYLTIVDNLSNAIENASEEYAQIKDVLTQIQKLARDSGSHIAVLHHAKGEYDSGTKPIPQSGGLQNPFKLPEVGLTLCRPDEKTLDAYIVKNRGGRSDPAAKSPIHLPVDFAKATVGGFQ